jgi:predicted membrane metal-binding protein
MSAIEPKLEPELEKSSSNRSFGMVFAGLFALIGAWPALDGNSPRYWAIILAFILLLAAGFLPSSLRPLNVLWNRFGNLLQKIVTPILMGAVFSLAITPTGLVTRALGKDPLRLKRDKNATSYWIERQLPGPDPVTMAHQF